jgi:hypothetical protein
MISKEATNTNVIVFSLTRPWLERTIYRTRGEHANHYTTDAEESLSQDTTYLHRNHDNIAMDSSKANSVKQSKLT